MSAPLQSRMARSGRTYTHPIDGGTFPSVTSSLGILNKPALIGWASRQVAEAAVTYYDRARQATDDWPTRAEAVDALKGAANRDRDGKGSLGTDVHSAVAEIVTHGDLLEPSQWSPDVFKHLDQFGRFIAEFRPAFLYAETTCYGYGYAGTLDLICDLPGYGRALIDYKTGSGPWPEAALQLSAYRFSDELVTGPPWERHHTPQIDLCAVLQLHPNKYDLIQVDAGYETFKAFSLAVRLATFRNEHFDQLVGDPLTPKVTA